MLDRTLFSLSLQLVALRIPARKCSEFMTRLQGHIIQRPKVKPITREPAGEPNLRLLLLCEEVRDLQLGSLPEDLRAYVQGEGATPVFHRVELDYSYFTAEQVLRQLLPEGMEVPSAFEQVGHIAHVNLRAEHLPFKQMIGQVLLDKNSPRIRTVVNKIDSISNEFRVFPMEVLAGDSEFKTQVKENSAVFRLDYREVYWNSRLEREHRRIVQMFGPGDVICDMFAGIGPFAVPAALRGCRVYANDLNPKSIEWLRANVEGNKVDKLVRVANEDAKDFVRGLLGKTRPAQAPAGSSSLADSTPGQSLLEFGEFGHVLMNLPASALDFLDVFVGLFDAASWRTPLPRVHCYCFSKAEDPAADVIQRAEEVMGCKLPCATASVVRDVAPSKLMMCLTFAIPDEVGWMAGEGMAGATDAKRRRTAQESNPPQ
mmetsp:Transcript_20132/g.46469  ORF Transcript_20132/g.46469 Transcript_20132/m.46469 type:complete len:429 (-) Transcript_20132:218-1504(-)